jgi:phosphoglycolate phosphatase
MLDVLRERGVKLGVLFNKPHEFTKIVVEKLLPAWKFDAVFGARDGVAIKPDPEGAMEALRAMERAQKRPCISATPPPT